MRHCGGFSSGSITTSEPPWVSPPLVVVPVHTGPVGRHLLVWAYLAILPHVRRYHAEHDVPDDVSWTTLSALGAEMATSRQITGMSGLDATWGLPRVFRGVTYRLGRLAFDRQGPRPDPADHPILRPGQSALNTHVPAGGRPLDPAACDESFASALESFPKLSLSACSHSAVTRG